MKRNNPIPDSEQDRAQVGIGTLIVFIAMVLVAAIAAGVLINTAGFLQTQAEATGEESTEQVTNLLNVESVFGFEEGNAGEINEVHFTVKKGPGSDTINLEDIEMQIITPGGSDVFMYEDFEETEAIVGDDPDRLEETADRTKIIIDLNTGETEPLDAGNTADVIITTGSGGQTFDTLRAPSPIESPTRL